MFGPGGDWAGWKINQDTQADVLKLAREEQMLKEAGLSTGILSLSSIRSKLAKLGQLFYGWRFIRGSYPRPTSLHTRPMSEHR